MRVSNLNSIEYSAYFKGFIKKATDVELLDGLMQNKKDTISFFKSIPEFKLDFAYDSGKWTVKQLLLHLIDVERIFVYRALRIARNDNTPLLSFDENLYATESQAEMYTIDQLLKSYQILRAYTINLFESFSNDMLLRIGEVSGSQISVRAIGFIIIGHEKHHIQIIKERYL